MWVCGEIADRGGLFLHGALVLAGAKYVLAHDAFAVQGNRKAVRKVRRILRRMRARMARPWVVTPQTRIQGFAWRIVWGTK